MRSDPKITEGKSPQAEGRPNPLVDDYLQNAKSWRTEMKRLRALLLRCELTEELKWGKPCYSFKKSNLAILLPLKNHLVLLLCKGALLKDPEGILIKPTENTQGARQIRFTKLAEIVGRETVLKAYIQEAIAAEKAGLEVTFKKIEEFKVPEEFQTKLDESPAFKSAFQALTPGRQRGYLLYFSAPKQSKTRGARIEKCKRQILDGKGLNDR